MDNNEYEFEEIGDLETETVTSLFGKLLSRKESLTDVVYAIEEILFHRYIDSLENPREALLEYREFIQAVEMDEEVKMWENIDNEEYQNSNTSNKVEEIRAKLKEAEKQRQDSHEREVDLQIELFKLQEELRKLRENSTTEEEE